MRLIDRLAWYALNALVIGYHLALIGMVIFFYVVLKNGDYCSYLRAPCIGK